MDLYVLIVLAVGAAFLAGLYGERWRARFARRRWQAGRRWGRGSVTPPRNERERRPQVVDAADQLRVVMGARFAKQPLLTKAEARWLYTAERAVRDQGQGWRVMAQVSLGEVLSSPDAQAYAAVNSKRVDLLVVSNHGEPIAAIEYQGDGHYQGSAPARDAVKKEALRKAGVRYIEVTPEHSEDDLVREILRLGRPGGPSQPGPGARRGD